jgi:hypothetical protein
MKPMLKEEGESLGEAGSKVGLLGLKKSALAGEGG